MADAVITGLLEQLAKIAREYVEKKVEMIMEAEKQVENLRCNLAAIRAVLVDAERKQLKDEGVKHWLEELKDVSYDVDSVLDEWITAIARSRSDDGENTTDRITANKVRFSFLTFCFFPWKGTHRVIIDRFNIAEKILDLNNKIDGITKRRNDFDLIMKRAEDFDNDRREWRSTTSELDVVVYGQDRDKKLLIELLKEKEEEIQFVSIVGMAGIGKTTLAKNVYNDEKVKGHFKRYRAWVCVSEPFNLVQIAKEIVEQFTGRSPTTVGKEALMQRFRECIKGKKFLLVLDDVWTSNYQEWEPLEKALRGGKAGSRVVVTTRKDEVVRMVGEQHVIPVEKLSEKDCWLLLREIAFVGNQRDLQDLEPIGREIAKKCDGLPLAAKTLGGLLRIKRSKEEWLHVLQSDLWKLDNVKENLFRPLLLSYYDLPALERRCFSYCAIFPKDYNMEKEDLIQQWMAQGYFNFPKNEAESTGLECFNNLAMRSFFQDFEYDSVSNKRIKSCKMHDIVHDFAQSLTLKEYGIASIANAQDSLEFDGRHLNLMVQCEEEYTISTPSSEKLHTLVVSSPSTCIFPNGLSDFKCLRSLTLTLEYGFKFPNGIGDLIHLRYLCLFTVAYEIVLPAKIGDLFNLQTLRLNCKTKLPEEIGKLINLRHLYAPKKYLSFLWPKEIGRLKGLQTMEVIRCGSEDEEFQLRDLGHLDNLRHICIKVFGRDEKEVEGAKQARLNNKMELVNLKLKFSRKAEDRHAQVHTNVLEALRPNQSLRYFGIFGYRGRNISPSWLTFLFNLEKLELTRCNNCVSLPPLGKLPSLESLAISMLRSLKSLGPEFLGVETGTCENNVAVTSFPKLKELKLDLVNGLSEWKGVTGWTNKGCLTIMPCIENLSISHCSRLESLPDFLETTPLKKLVIDSCQELKISCEKEKGTDWPKICHVPYIQIL